MEYRIGRLNGRFVVSWWIGGKRRRHRLGALDRKAAEREALDVIRREAAAPASGAPTVADVWAAYRGHLGERRAGRAMDFEWRALGPRFGHLRPDQITGDLCRAHTAARRAAGIRDGTIWTELGRLRTALTWAAKPGRRMIAWAPEIPRPPKPAPKDRWLTRAEIDRLLAAPSAPHVRLAVLLMLATAARPTAALELTWDRVDFERGQIDLRVDADGPRKGRAVVPMNAGLRAALLEARRAALTEHVVEWCGEPVRSIRTGLASACEAAGLAGVTPHVLRHTAAVHLAAAGVSMQKIAQYLGHSDTRVTERVYARYAPDHMREEAAILDFAAGQPRAVKVH